MSFKAFAIVFVVFPLFLFSQERMTYRMAMDAGYESFNNGNIEGSITFYTLAITKNGKIPVPYVSRSLSYLRLKNYKEALADVNRALAVDSTYSKAYSTRGIIRMEQGDAIRAIKDFEMALKFNPENAQALFNYSYLNQGLLNYEDAITGYSQLIHLDSSEQFSSYLRKAYFYRGIAFSDIGQNELALQDLTSAYQMDSSIFEPLYYRGVINHELGKLKRALYDMNLILEDQPRNGQAFFYRAIVLSDSGLTSRAINDFTTIIQADDESDLAYQYRGLAFAREQKFDESIRDISRAIDLNPQNVVAINLRGNIYFQVGKMDEACKDWREAYKSGVESLAETIKENCGQ